LPKQKRANQDRLVTMMIDEDLARIRTHRNNIARYWRLLRADLAASDRSFIERRLAEERASLNALAAKTYPVALAKSEPCREATSAA